jgi:hypothetical protein
MKKKVEGLSMVITPVMLTTWEAEMWKTEVQCQLCQEVWETPPPK